MAFESLTEKLQNVFKNLRSKGRLTEADVKTALKEVKMALLEADVSFKVVKQFIKSVQEQAVGQDVMNGLNPGQMVIKIVNDELVKLMGSETTEIALRPASEVTIIMMAGLQGAGKTGTAEKLPRRNGKYLVSFIGYAPQENPQVVVYVVVNEPNAQGQANSGFATELASKIMGEIFPYLGIEKTAEKTE